MARKQLIARQPFHSKVAIVCGGSKGIGRATAQEIVALGGSVCLVAREPETLAAAAHELTGQRSNESQFVETIACDTADMEALAPALAEFVVRRGVPDYLINTVGYARPDYVQNLTLNDYRQIMETNYFGQLVPILTLLPHFMAARKGHIANVSSMMGFMGIIGYASYAPTKYAIVGLSEVLRHELKPFNVRVSILFPSDTDTPGFEEENKTKPAETAIMSASAGIMSAEAVAEIFVAGLLKGRFEIMPSQARFIWRLFRFLPGLVRAITDRDYAKARRQVANT